MPNYYTEITEDIIPGHLAYADDINLIQHGIQAALAQIICDNFGDGYVLDDDEDAFLMTPVGTGDEQIDQMNRTSSYLVYQSMTDVYVRQTIDITKSSVSSITVKVSNDSGANQVLRGELRTIEGENIDSDLIASYEVTVPASQTGAGDFTFDFNAHHLPEDSYYLVIKYATGIKIALDESGAYNQSFATSVNGVQYEVVPKDLWFEERYATEGTYDIDKGIAVIHGEKIQSVDTHVTIAERSLYGNRIDIVIMDKEGIYSVIQGDAIAIGKPIAPDSEIPFGSLKIAYVTVPVSIPGVDPEPILVDQEDILGHARMRRHEERLRRLEKKTDWIFNYNSPERIKYNLTGSTFYDSGASSNVEAITAGTRTIGYRLSSYEVNDYYWSFKDFNGNPPIEGEYEKDNGISKFINIDHSNHNSGICKLQKRTNESYIYNSGGAGRTRIATPRGVYASDPYYWKRKHEIYRDNSRQSEYPANTFKITTETTLSRIIIDSRHYRNAASVKCVIYRKGGGRIATSASKDLRRYPGGAYNIIRTPILDFNFSGITLSPGTYVWVLVVEPKALHTKAEVWMDSVNYYGRPVSFLSLGGSYPPNIPSGTYVKYNLAETLLFDIYALKDVMAPSGTIQSSMIDTTEGIGSVAMDMNLSLPSGTSYELYVTNDNGTTWQRMQGKYLNFTTDGHQFMWKLILKTNNNSATPTLSYSISKQYAVKFTLGLTGGSPKTDGVLVTKPFCGDLILQEALPVTSGINKFSHWEWLRMWCEENAGDISIDIEAVDALASPEANTDWTFIKSGLSLDELYHGSVDYSNYEGSYEEDEYNYHCDVDEEIILEDEVIIDRCEEAWVETEDDDYTTHLLDETVYQEGTASTKTTFAHYTGEEPVFMSKALESLDLTGYDSLQFEIRTNKAEGFEPGDLQFCIGTSAKCATGEYHDIPAIATTTWTTVTVPITDPEALAAVMSIGVKRPTEGTEWNSFSIWIDNVIGIISNLRVIDTCETTPGFTKAQNDDVTTSRSATHKEGSYSSQIQVSTLADTGLIAYKELNEDLSKFNQIRFWIQCDSTAINAGDFDIVFGSDEECEEVINDQGYYIPHIDPGSWTRVTIDLENPSDYEAVQSIGIRMLNLRNITFRIDMIEGIKTVKYPFYQKCVRFRFNLHRDEGTNLSPTIRKVGVIPVVD